MNVGPIVRDQESAPFFDAAAAGVLLLRQCPESRRYFAPNVTECDCGGDLEWVQASGTGRLISWATVPGRTPNSPPERILAIVELDEGPWMRSSVVGAAVGDLVLEARVEVVFRRAEQGEAVPLFALAQGSAGAPWTEESGWQDGISRGDTVA